MFAIRVSADGRVIEIPRPPADIPAEAVGAILLGSIGFDWGIDALEVVEYGSVTDSGLVVVAAGSNAPTPVNLPGEAVIRALEPFGIETDTDNETRDSVWVLQVRPESLTGSGWLVFDELPADVAETVKRAAESAPVSGAAVAAVHVPEDDPDVALAALVASLSELEGVSVLSLDPQDPASSLAALAAVLGEAPPDVYADVSHDRS